MVRDEAENSHQTLSSSSPSPAQISSPCAWKALENVNVQLGASAKPIEVKPPLLRVVHHSTAGVHPSDLFFCFRTSERADLEVNSDTVACAGPVCLHSFPLSNFQVLSLCSRPCPSRTV